MNAVIDEKVIRVNMLEKKHLLALFNRELQAIVVPNYHPPERCNKIAAQLRKQVIESKGFVGEIYKSDINSFFNTVGNNVLGEQFFASSVPYMRMHRELEKGHLSPADKLRLELDEIWEGGALLMRLNGRPMLFGITRLWGEGSEGLPHQDIIRREIPEANEIKGMLGQLGINVYITCPEKGGEIELWDYEVTDEEWDQKEVPGSYGFSREKLPKPKVLITPNVGDLILIDSTRVHAIRKIEVGDRITLSGFIGNWGENLPLRMWA